LTIEIKILGPLEVVCDGAPVGLGGPRQRALLALLLTRSGTIVPRDRLIDELWGHDPPRSAVNVLQTYVSHLRKALPAGRLVTRPPGYSLHVEPDELDLHRFEKLVAQGRRSFAEGDAEAASLGLRQALALWRGPALADVVEADFARIEATRLEELRLAALEERLQADLALGRHGEIIGDLETLVAEHPLRERLRIQLMLALYRSDRQSEALAVYREARSTLVDQLGIEPGQGLRDMEAAILRQDPSLDSPVGLASANSSTRTLVVVSVGSDALDSLLALAEPLALRPLHELVLVRLVQDGSLLEGASQAASDRRAALVERQIPARAVAFTSTELAPDIIRLAQSPDAVLLLVDAAGGLLADGRFEPWLATVLSEAPCDVAILADADAAPTPDAGAPVVVPFGGAQHEWAAAEIAAWIAGAEDRPLELLGAAADPLDSRRDASRLLASVALLVQQVAAVDTKPSLLGSGPNAAIEAIAGARAVVVGLPDDWSSRGLGDTRADLVLRARVPALLVRGGLRPGGLAPAESLTRFTWTLTGRGR
jgi:DNA-binding SARP family transcriptional activator